MEERKDLIQWIKEHRRQLIFAGIGIGTMILIALGLKNQEEIRAVRKSLERAVKHPTAKAVTEAALAPVPRIAATVASSRGATPFEVGRHIRNLPDGWHASPEKVAEALKNNIILREGQTWVDSYMKGGAAA